MAVLLNKSADAINLLGGCSGQLTSNCKSKCTRVDFGSWRAAPLEGGFVEKSSSKKICASCRSAWMRQMKELEDESVARAAVAEATSAGRPKNSRKTPRTPRSDQQEHLTASTKAVEKKRRSDTQLLGGVYRQDRPNAPNSAWEPEPIYSDI